MNPDSLHQVVNHLKLRISSLEDQYRGFVKYCIDMIKNHRLMIDSELKNDPNTPRELLKQITLHGEHLENSVKLASSSIKIQETLKISAFETFKYEILFLLKEPSSDSHKSSRIETLVSNLELYISTNYCKKDINSPDYSQRTKSRTKTQNSKYEKSKNEEISKLNSVIHMQNQKISELQRDLEDKNEKFQQVYSKLDKIKKQQVINTININSHCNSLQYSKIISPDLRKHDLTMTYDMNLSSQSFIKPEDSFESRNFYNMVKRKLVGLSELVKKFTAQVCILDEIIGQYPEFDSFLHTFRADTQELGKVIEEIVTPRFKEEVSERRKEYNDFVGQIRKLKAEKESLSNECKVKDLKLEQMKSANENLNSELKTTKGKLIANVKIIDSLHLKIQEIYSDNKRIQDQLGIQKENDGFLKPNRLSSVASEKSAENYSVRIEKNLEIINTFNLSIKNVYKNENLIRELRKMLKLKEKECADKDSLISNFDKEPTKSSNLQDVDKNERPEFTSIKNRFSYEENLALSKKLSFALMEKAKIEEKFQDSERFVGHLQDTNKNLNSEIEILKVQIAQNSEKGKKSNIRLAVVCCCKIQIIPDRDFVGEEVEKMVREKTLKLMEENQEVKTELSFLLIKIERAERELKDTEINIKISNDKIQIYERENEKLSKLLTNFEENSQKQDSLIQSLQKEKESLSNKLEDLTTSISTSDQQYKYLTQHFSSSKYLIENQVNNNKIFIEKIIKKIDSQIHLQSSKLSRLFKLFKNLSIRLQISSQTQASNIKSLNMRIEDRENSIQTLTLSLKLAESTISTQNSKNIDLEKEKKSLLATHTSLSTQIAILTEQLKQKSTESANEKTDSISASIHKFTEIIKNYETSKESLQSTIKENEILINSLKLQLNSLECNFQQFEKYHQATIQEKDSKISSNFEEIEILLNKIKILESQIQALQSKNPDDEIKQIKSVFQSQIKILDSDYKQLEERLKITEDLKNKEIEKLKKNLEGLNNQLANSNLNNEELKNKDFDVLKCCKFQDTTWYLIKIKQDNKLFWTDQSLNTNVKNDEEEFKAKYLKVKNYCFRLREEYKRLKKKIQVWRKEAEFEKKLAANEVNDDLFELTSPFISPRDTEIQQIYDGLKSARSYGTDFDEDTFGELSSKIVKEGNSIFNASSFEEINEDTDKINLLLEKMNGELQVKNEVIRNYEKMISELKANKD